MSAASIGSSSVRSYNPVAATGECSLCATKEISLYRLHRPTYGEVYDSAKHGPLLVETGHLGFAVSITTETIAKAIFQRVGTDPEADDRVRLFTDDHASCADCIRRMMSASQILKCPFCRIPIPKNTIHLPPASAAAAGTRSPAPRSAGSSASRGGGSSSAHRGSAAEAQRSESRRSEGRSYRDAAASPASDEARTYAGRQRPPRHPVGGADMLRAFGDDFDQEAVGAPPTHPTARRVDFTGIDRASIDLIKELMRAEGLSNRELLELQHRALPDHQRSTGIAHAAGSVAGEDPDPEGWNFRAIGSYPRPSGTRSAPSMIGSGAVGAPSGAVASTTTLAPIPGLSVALSFHPLIVSLIAEMHCDAAMLDEPLATALIANEGKVRLLLSKQVLFTVIPEYRGWIFSQYFGFNPSESIIPQMAITARYEARSPLARLYKQTVSYARFAPLAEGEAKLRLEAEIRETLATLSEEDLHLIEEWIWRENGEPLTLDPAWGRNNPFHSAPALYSAINKAVHLKLFILSAAERTALISRCEGETSNICRLADSFM
ncbi:MAG: hypothetical protein NTX49_04650 [Chlamydiae bacterium]|nr:hypothetical protein [Chlamydiota bacterium]